MAVESKMDVEPLQTPKATGVDFGAVIQTADLENLTGRIPVESVTSSDADFKVIRQALYTYQVVVFKDQQGLSPKAQFELTRRFDPSATSYGHGKTLDAKRSILHPDLKTIPHQPQVQVIGHGFVAEHEGLTNVQLRHPHHRTFHATAIPEHLDHDHTRFYRWHIDAALYGGLAPPLVTTLLAVRVPGGGRRQTCHYDDEITTDGNPIIDTLDVPLGTTAFASGYTAYDQLSPADQLFARTTKVEYAAHPYIWMSSAKSRADGIGLLSQGLELLPDQLPPVSDPAHIQILPMCWKNPLTGRLALQIHPSAVRRLHLADGSVVEDLREVREICHRLQRPGIKPGNVYAHDWEAGDLVLFHNRGVLHSVVGAFAEGEIRLFHQCNVAASHFPVGPDDDEAE